MSIIITASRTSQQQPQKTCPCFMNDVDIVMGCSVGETRKIIGGP